MLEYIPFPAEILHELRGQLNRIPLDTIDAGHAQLLNFSEQMMQAVAKFVEQGDDIIVGEQGRFATDRRGEIAGEKCYRMLNFAVFAATRYGIVHPRATTLVVAGIEVKIKLSNQRAVVIAHVKKARVGVPDFGSCRRDLQAVNCFNDAEQAGQHLRFGEVLLDLVIGKRITLLAQFFRQVGDVPGIDLGHIQFAQRKFFELGPIALGKRLGFGSHLAQEANHLGGRVRHLGGERQLCVVGKSQQRGIFGAQLQNALNGYAVVPRCIVTKLRGAGGVGAIKAFAQRLKIGVLHHRHIRGRLQGKLPPRLALFIGRFTRGGDGIFRQAG